MSPHQSVFKDETKLDLNYIPVAKMPHREKEQTLLMEFFSFLTQNPDRMTQRVIITGEVGTGKTALAQNFGQQIIFQTNKKKIKLFYVHVNCREVRGKLFLIIQHALGVVQPNFPKRGYSVEEALGVLLQTLDEQNTFMVLVLDEFDSLIEFEGSEAVYKLTRIGEMRQGKPQRVSFLFIMRNLKAVDQLDASAKSTLQSNIINLARYSQQQLVDILNSRVAMAFELGAVDEEAVTLIAELASTESGNARFAIELLWRAGKYADAENKSMVEPEFVRQAVSSIIPTIRRSELASLGFHEILFLLSVARYFKENPQAYASLWQIKKAYAVVCEEYGQKPNSHTQIWKYVKMLSSLGILKTEVISVEGRGRTSRIYLPSIPARELEQQLSITLDKRRSEG